MYVQVSSFQLLVTVRILLFSSDIYTNIYFGNGQLLKENKNGSTLDFRSTFRSENCQISDFGRFFVRKLIVKRSTSFNFYCQKLSNVRILFRVLATKMGKSLHLAQKSSFFLTQYRQMVDTDGTNIRTQ